MASVGIILVSHSRALADAVAALVRQAAGPDVRLAVAAGFGDDAGEFGTDATRIAAAITGLDSPAGCVVIMDLGSAILSAETALECLAPDVAGRVTLCAAPFVEGALAAAVAAAGGADRSAVAGEARSALRPKESQLGVDPPDAAAAGTTSVAPAAGPAVDIDVVVGDPAGVHLRPAAQIARIAREAGGQVRLQRADDGRTADASRLTEVLGLAVPAGARVHVRVAGRDAAATAAQIEAVLAVTPGSGGAHADAPTPGADALADGPFGASPGVACGRAWLLKSELPDIARTAVGSVDAQQDALARALTSVYDASTGLAPIMAAQREFLRDPGLRDRAFALMEERRLDAASAWIGAVREAAARIGALDNALVRARARDLIDVALRVLHALGEPVTPLAPPKGASVVAVANELLPSQASGLDPQRVLGVVDRGGGVTTHAAILLRARGIPAVVGAARLGTVADGAEIALDGTTGEVWVHPGAAVRARLQEQARNARAVASHATGRVTLADRTVVELWANAATPSEAEAARRADAQGIGLLRTEFLFLERATAPDEDEQVAALRAVIAPMRERPVHVRTLDAGADKALPFMRLAAEENPSLGVRGVRATLARPGLFATQLRAILRAGAGVALGITVPMVSEPDEVVAVRRLLQQAHAALDARGVAHAWPVQLGIMVEVPATALQIAEFATVSDYYSIGTNDLTQYAFAADRSNAQLARFHDAGRSAVLALCRNVVAHGGRPTSVCGEAAGDPRIAPGLVEAGIRRLSLAPILFGGVRAALAPAAHVAVST